MVQIHRFCGLIILCCVLLCILQFSSTIANAQIQQQQQHDAIITPQEDDEHHDHHPVHKGFVTTFSMPVKTDRWHAILLAIMSFHRLEIYHKVGPYGLLHNDTKGEQARVRSQLPELNAIYDTTPNPSGDVFTNIHNQPRYINLQNFLLKLDDIRHNIDHQIKYNSYESDYYRNIELNDPYFKLNSELFNNNLKILTVQSNINLDVLLARYNTLMKQAETMAATTPVFKPTPTTDWDDPEVKAAIFKEQSTVYEMIQDLFPITPYLRLELETTRPLTGYTMQLYEKEKQQHIAVLSNFKHWLQSYADIALHSSYIYLKIADYPRYWKHQPSTVIFVEPDRIVHHGNHYEKASESGGRALILLFVVFGIIMGSQLFFQWWAQHPEYQGSYNLFIVITLWLVPLAVAIIDHFKRFVIIWWCYSIITLLIISLLFVDLNPPINAFLSFLDNLGDNIQQQQENIRHAATGNTNGLDDDIVGRFPQRPYGRGNNNNTPQIKNYYIIPQRYIFAIIYKYFLLVHKSILVLIFFSIAVFVLDVFGIFQALGLEPHMVGETFHGHSATPDEVLRFIFVALYSLFYGIYFGVLNRDIATVVIPQLTVLASHYKLTKALGKANIGDGKLTEQQLQQKLQKNNNNNDGLLGGSGFGFDDGNNNVNIKDQQQNQQDKNFFQTLGRVIGDDGNNNNNNNTDNSLQYTDREDGDYDDDDELRGITDKTSILSKHASRSTTTTTTTTSSEQQHSITTPRNTQITTSLVNKDNSCGICHELLKSQKDQQEQQQLGVNSSTNNIPQDLPTIAEIRNRLRRGTGGRGGGSANGQDGQQKGVFGVVLEKMLTFSTLTFFWFLEMLDNITGGTGHVNIEKVTIVEGMYTIQSQDDVSASANTNRNNQNAFVPQNHQNAGYYDDDDDDDNTHPFGGGSGLRGGSFAAGMARQEENHQTNNDVTFQLPCGCFTHDLCLRGYMLLGKYNVCPACKEISPVGELFVEPWNASYEHYKNFLDSAKYCIAINPLLLFIINIILNLFW